MEEGINESHWFLYWYHPYHHPRRMRVCSCLGTIRSHLTLSVGSSKPTYKNMRMIKITASTIYLSVCSESTVVFHLFILIFATPLSTMCHYQHFTNEETKTEIRTANKWWKQDSKLGVTDSTGFSLPLPVCSEQGDLKQYLVRKNDMGVDIQNPHENIALFLNIAKSVAEKMD